MARTITIYHDPGHSWAKVHRKTLHELGIAHLITPYSYQRGEHVYLEEDCDFAAFLDAWKHQRGGIPPFRERYTNRQSKIRSYRSYSNI